MEYNVTGFFKYGGENYKPGMKVAGLDPETEKYLLGLGDRIEPVEQAAAPEADAGQAAAEAAAREQAEREAAEAARVEALRQQGLDANGQPLQPQQPVIAPPAPQPPTQPTADQIANDPDLQ